MVTRREIEREYAESLSSGLWVSWLFFFILGWACHGDKSGDCAPGPVDAAQQNIDYGPP